MQSNAKSSTKQTRHRSNENLPLAEFSWESPEISTSTSFPPDAFFVVVVFVTTGVFGVRSGSGATLHFFCSNGRTNFQGTIYSDSSFMRTLVHVPYNFPSLCATTKRVLVSRQVLCSLAGSGRPLVARDAELDRGLPGEQGQEEKDCFEPELDFSKKHF